MNKYICECLKTHKNYTSWYIDPECKDHKTCCLYDFDGFDSMRLRVGNNYCILYIQYSLSKVITIESFDFVGNGFREGNDISDSLFYEFTTIEDLREYLIKLSENLVFY